MRAAAFRQPRRGSSYINNARVRMSFLFIFQLKFFSPSAFPVVDLRYGCRFISVIEKYFAFTRAFVLQIALARPTFDCVTAMCSVSCFY